MDYMTIVSKTLSVLIVAYGLYAEYKKEYTVATSAFAFVAAINVI